MTKRKDALEKFCAAAELDVELVRSALRLAPVFRPDAFVLDRVLAEVYWMSPQSIEQSAFVADQLIIGEPAEVVLTLSTHNVLTVAEYQSTWGGLPVPIESVRESNEISIANSPSRTEQTVDAIKALRRSRRRRFQRCHFCKEMIPPEYYFARERACYGCCSEHLGFVY